MFPRTLVEELPRALGTKVRCAGWIHALRRMGGVTFFTLRERSGTAQVVIRSEALPASFRAESVVSVVGEPTLAPSEGATVELQAVELEVLSPAAEGLPYAVRRPRGAPEPGLATALDHRALSLREPRKLAVFRVEAAIIAAFAGALRRRGFTEIKTPKIVCAGAEGGAELFPVTYFEERAFLTQSPQFYKQIMVASGLERVFEVGPAFRAERHNTSRHLNEFVSLDVEQGFLEELDGLLTLEEAILGEIFDHLAATCGKELTLLGVPVPRVRSIPRLTFAEAKARLGQAQGSTREEDLSPAEEKALCQAMEAEFGFPGVFVTRYPRSHRPAYALPCAEAPTLTESYDLLYGGQEITTGGLRIHDAAQLETSLRSRGLEPERFAFYLEAFRFGMPPHGGFAIGCERFTASLLGLDNIRQACLFPRDRSRLIP